MRSRLPLLVSLLALAFLAPLAMGDGAATRPAPPDPAAVRKAAAAVNDLYRNELARRPKPEDQAALAGTMLKAAGDEPDPATKLALLNKAVELAIEAGDIETTTAALDQIDSTWQIDSPASRTKAMVELSRHVRTAEGQTSMAHRLEAEATEAVAAGWYDPAREAIDAAIGCARHGNDPGLVDELSPQAAGIARLQSAHERIEPALATLKSKPKDPAANLAVGRFECFVKGDWASGLPMLARGSDPKLKSLSERELAGSPTADDRVAAADGWWEWSLREDEHSRQQVQSHAADLYRKALPALAGLARVRVQRRVDAVEHQAAAARAGSPAPASSGQIKLLNLTNAHEAGQILAQVLHDYPDALKDVKRATLAFYHNGSDYNHVGGGSRRLPGAFSPSPQISDNGHGFLFWGVSDTYKPGKYLVACRIQPLSPVGTGHFADMDLYTEDGEGLAAHHLDASDLHPGQWSTVPMVMSPGTRQKVECRSYTSAQRAMALDRVYVFELH